MEFRRLMQDLDLSPEVMQQLEARRDLVQQNKPLFPGLTVRVEAEESYTALDKALKGDDMAMLACQLWIAAEARAKWQEKGIPDRIFLDTMNCFPRFLGEALRKTGRVEFDRGWWTYRQLSMTIFRIGALEYELLSEPGVISIHIPSNARIEPALVEESLVQARTFFKKYYPDFARRPMICHSWLLSPELGAVLGDGSRILAFQKRFAVLKSEPEAMDCLEWLFAAPEGTPLTDLREDTSLQRSVKKKLLEGGHIGCSLGVLLDDCCPDLNNLDGAYGRFLA